MTYLEDALTLHAETLAAWNEARTAARKIKDPAERAAALEVLKGKRPVHPYFGGLSLTALRQGNHRLLAPIRARHADAKAEHAETFNAWKERRTKALEIKDPAERAKTLEALKGERPTHPRTVMIGCAVVSAALLAGIPAVRHYAPVSITTGLTLWMITALVLGQKRPDHTQQPPAEQTRKSTPEADGREPDEEPEEDAEEEPSPTEPTPAEARHVVAVLGADGTHVARTIVAARLAAAHPLWKPSAKAVTALLTQAGVRVRDGVRVDGVSVPGIHHDDVPPLPSSTTSTRGPGVVAGQSDNNNHNNAEERPTREGFVMRADPDDPARTIIVSRAATA
ncbi:hypothetical protein [Kitasatospora sp. NPDC057738]|uniref:hypothetical protein n=1 Tax=Kitasatospora sp. NPDC057738 TaxID=3346233 RepID=UPI0036AF604E